MHQSCSSICSVKFWILCYLQLYVVQRDFTKVYKYLKGGCKGNGAWLFSVVLTDRTRGPNWERRFQVNIRKYFFTVTVTEHWHRLEEVLESSSLEIRKSHLDMVLGKRVLSREVWPNDLQRSYSTSAILWSWDVDTFCNTWDFVCSGKELIFFFADFCNIVI